MEDGCVHGLFLGRNQGGGHLLPVHLHLRLYHHARQCADIRGRAFGDLGDRRIVQFIHLDLDIRIVRKVFGHPDGLIGAVGAGPVVNFRIVAAHLFGFARVRKPGGRGIRPGTGPGLLHFFNHLLDLRPGNFHGGLLVVHQRDRVARVQIHDGAHGSLRSGRHVHANFVALDLRGHRAVNHRAFNGLLQDQVGVRGNQADSQAENDQGAFHGEAILRRHPAEGKQKN